MNDWMLVDEAVIKNDVVFKNFINGPNEEGTGNYEHIHVATDITAGITEDFKSSRFKLYDCYPNPVKGDVNIGFRINGKAHVKLSLLDSQGRQLRLLMDEEKEEGEYFVKADMAAYPAGLYLYEVKAGILNDTKKMIVIR